MPSSVIQLTQTEMDTVQEILGDHLPSQIKVKVFGSRAGGSPKPYSDLDLVLIGQEPIDLALRGQLNEAFSQSSLTFKVDLVDWCQISPDFQGIIAQNSLPLLVGGKA